jgi:glycosyltransferase involved in cell wall biosynthesis
MTHPEYVRSWAPARHARYIAQLAQSASVILTNSKYTLDSLTGLATTHNMRFPRSVVAPLGVGDAFRARPARHGSAKPYFAFISTIEPRKNHVMLLQVWQRLVKQHGETAPKLVLVGARGWQNESVLGLLNQGTDLKNHVIECNNVSDETLVALIANARATLLPSHVEGYGLPLAESLSLGTPVLCSDLPPYFEIAGNIPEYIDPMAGKGWARLIMDYAAERSERRTAQLERMAKFRAPRWSDHFATLETVLATLGYGNQSVLAA